MLQIDLTELTTSDASSAFWAAVAVSIILPQIPQGKKLLYPFAFLGTWAHEGGHGLGAILAGGKFRSLEIYSNLGGVAYSSGVGRKARAFVSAAGLLGPAIAGGTIIIFSAKAELAPFILAGLAVLLSISALLFIRNRFGFVATLVIAGLLAGLCIYGDANIRIFVAQLIGIQFCVSSFSTLDYMFTSTFLRDGREMNSDTQDISDALFLPYWFWATLIFLTSIAILGASFFVAWIR